jgi:hypothetical protein
MAMRSHPAKLVAQRVTEVVRAGGDQCFGCLAERSGLDEHDVRTVALVLVCRPAWTWRADGARAGRW